MVEAGVVFACQNLTRHDVEEELTGMYSQRVLAGKNHPSAPSSRSERAKKNRMQFEALVSASKSQPKQMISGQPM